MSHGRLPPFRSIEAFASAAETLSFKTAAERINITVSAVSHRISVLEKEVGLRLFDRSGRNIRLTPAGISYRDRLLPLLGEIMAATEEIQGETDSTLIRIASFNLFNSQWLAPRIGEFLTAFPAARVELATLRRRHKIHPDITIQIIRPGEVGAEHEPLFGWRVSPVCRPELVERCSLREPKDICSVRIIETASAPEAWQSWLELAGAKLNPHQDTIVVDSPTLSLDLVVAGAGVGLSADVFADRFDALGLVRPFEVRFDFPGGVFINRASPYERPMVQAFRHWLRHNIDVD